MDTYRRFAWYAGSIFAPQTRGMESANALALKLGPAGEPVLTHARRDPRRGFTDAMKARWLTFEMSFGSYLRVAIEWRTRTHEAAR